MHSSNCSHAKFPPEQTVGGRTCWVSVEGASTGTGGSVGGATGLAAAPSGCEGLASVAVMLAAGACWSVLGGITNETRWEPT